MNDSRPAYVIQASPFRRMLFLLLSASYVVAIFVIGWPSSGGKVASTTAVALFMGYVGLTVFVNRTRIMNEGVEHRSWFGKTRLHPYDEIGILERVGKSVVIQVNGRELLKATNRDADLDTLTQFLKTRVEDYRS